ncbi:hypothetical protein GUJ93_ZPchr0012g19866 [Zizania palustris]|uniref:Uncharacterized protein n=1 Tax=Zizania palustris TaxID=103762 RepID=A0A8J5WN72_ZIZPA|nr:hypothetical protein GUJ93_ZPchr0012g19866 [Zizania palustris]
MAASVPNGHHAVADGEGLNTTPPTPSSSLVFLGTGFSSAVPNARCLIQPPDPPCPVCSQSLSVPPELNPNYRYVSSPSSSSLYPLEITGSRVSGVLPAAVLRGGSGCVFTRSVWT